MKILIYKGSSQYDILSARAQFLNKAFQKAGHECVLYDLGCFTNGADVMSFISKFNPDFTFGINSWGFENRDRTPHFELTGIPHILYILDSIWHNLDLPIIKDLNNEKVLPIFTEKNYYDEFQNLNISPAFLSPYLSGNRDIIVPFENKLYEMVFFGGFTSLADVIHQVENLSNNMEVKEVIKSFIQEIKDFILSTNKIFPHNLSEYVESFVKDTFQVEGEELNNIMLMLFPVIDKFYNSLIRETVIERFALAGLDIIVFTPSKSNIDFSRFTNVRVRGEVNYYEHLNIVAHSKVHLNITPTKISMHDRIPDTLANGTILCSNIMPHLLENYPLLNESSIFYDLDNIEEVAKRLKLIVNDGALYKSKVSLGEEIFRMEFSPCREVDRIIDAYNRYF